MPNPNREYIQGPRRTEYDAGGGMNRAFLNSPATMPPINVPDPAGASYNRRATYAPPPELATATGPQERQPYGVYANYLNSIQDPNARRKEEKFQNWYMTQQQRIKASRQAPAQVPPPTGPSPAGWSSGVPLPTVPYTSQTTNPLATGSADMPAQMPGFMGTTGQVQPLQTATVPPPGPRPMTSNESAPAIINGQIYDPANHTLGGKPIVPVPQAPQQYTPQNMANAHAYAGWRHSVGLDTDRNRPAGMGQPGALIDDPQANGAGNQGNYSRMSGTFNPYGANPSANAQNVPIPTTYNPTPEEARAHLQDYYARNPENAAYERWKFKGLPGTEVPPPGAQTQTAPPPQTGGAPVPVPSGTPAGGGHVDGMGRGIQYGAPGNGGLTGEDLDEHAKQYGISRMVTMPDGSQRPLSDGELDARIREIARSHFEHQVWQGSPEAQAAEHAVQQANQERRLGLQPGSLSAQEKAQGTATENQAWERRMVEEKINAPVEAAKAKSGAMADEKERDRQFRLQLAELGIKKTESEAIFKASQSWPPEVKAQHDDMMKSLSALHKQASGPMAEEERPAIKQKITDLENELKKFYTDHATKRFGEVNTGMNPQNKAPDYTQPEFHVKWVQNQSGNWTHPDLPNAEFKKNSDGTYDRVK
jgi:hypothetical protein